VVYLLEEMPLERWAKEQTAKQKGLAFLAKRDSFCASNVSLWTKETMGGYGKQALPLLLVC
jgi:hypothetical protein